jgi:transcriptional regulator with XRE-family HTH domain
MIAAMSIQIFVTNILRLMEEQGLNKVELAERADLSMSFLSDLTHGKANPSLRIMASIADALGVSLPYMLEATDLTPAEVVELNGDRQAAPSLPKGFERVSAVLPEFQAFQVRQWAEVARRRLQSTKA